MIQYLMVLLRQGFEGHTSLNLLINADSFERVAAPTTALGRHNLWRRRLGEGYKNLLLIKALPEPDLRYCSNVMALSWFSKDIEETSIHGLYFAV